MNGRKKPILHLEDWFDSKGRRTAVVQTSTRNTSFIRMYRRLDKMGIKNNLFHLSLLDPKLQKIEPENLNDDNDPTREFRLRVAVESRWNPWYFFREVCKVPAQGGNAVPFELHRGNLAMLWCFFSNINLTSTQPRQSGKSITAVAICCYVLYIVGHNMEIGMLTLNNKILQANVKRVKDIRNELPKYLVMESPNDNDNKEGLYYAALNNKYLTYAGQKDRRAAGDVGRGASSPFLHVDEPPFIPNIDKTLPTILASTDAARATAKAAGQYHANIFTTTAGDPTTEEGKFIREFLDKAMKFSEVLYDTKDNAQAHAMVKANSTNALVDATFSYLQLGKSHEWFKEQITSKPIARSQVERDYLNKWVSLAENPILDKAITDRMYRTRKDDPCFNDVWGDYVIKWYVPRQEVLSGYWKSKPLIMGFDGSELIGNDFSTCVAIDPTTMATIFTFRCNESSIAKFSMFIADLLIAYRKILWVPERKSVAPGMIDTVTELLQRHGQNPFKRIFNKLVDNRDMEDYAKYDLDDPSLADTTAARKALGFMTTGHSRPVLYKQVLQKAAEAAADRIYDPTLINELTSLQARNGRLDHKTGGHDDMVMGWLLACYVVFEGKNLSFYGIDPLAILQDVTTDEGVSPYHVADQRELRTTIKELVQLAHSAVDDYRRRMVIYDIERMLPRVDTGIAISPLSADSVRQDSFDYRDIIREVTNLKRGSRGQAGIIKTTQELFGVMD